MVLHPVLNIKVLSCCW